MSDAVVVPKESQVQQSEAVSRTALVIIDPFNAFVSPFGKTWLLTRRTIRHLDSVRHMRALMEAARRHRVQICFAPHKHHTRDAYSSRRFFNPSIYMSDIFKVFARGSWGGRFRTELTNDDADFVATEHLTSSGFIGTDLHEFLSSHQITHLYLCGCLSNTCIESTARSAIELGYHVTIVEDAVAAMSLSDHRAAVETGYPLCSHRVVKFQAVLDDWSP